jgi:hypothetical protein
MIAQIFSELFAVSTNSPKLRAFQEMNFVLVPDNQPLVPIQFVTYPDESDPSPYPIPSNLPVEGWPSQTGTLTLNQVQHDTSGDGGDRHAIIIQPGTGFIWETWQTLLTSNPTNWEAANGAKFNLTNNALRPPGWTSADAAGLSMLGGLARFDECETQRNRTCASDDRQAHAPRIYLSRHASRLIAFHHEPECAQRWVNDCGSRPGLPFPRIGPNRKRPSWLRSKNTAA